MPNMRKKPTGAIPTSRARLAASRPHICRGATPSQFFKAPAKLSYWLNDVDGDCVTAEEAFAKGVDGYWIDDDTVKAWATYHDVLNGADLLSVLQWMVKAGFSQGGTVYDDGTPSSVDWTNSAVLNNAISQGPVKIGVAADQLQSVVGESNGWFGIGFKQTNQEEEDHCVSLCGYGSISWLAQQLEVSVPNDIDGTKPGHALFTWKTIGIIDVPSMLAITWEAWLRSPTSMVVGPTPPSPTPAPTPMPGPTPAPTPSPSPTPPTSVIEAVNTAFAAIEAEFFSYPRIVQELEVVRSMIVDWLTKHGYSDAHGTRGRISAIRGTIGPQVVPIVDAAFAAAEAAYPMYAPLMMFINQMLDKYLNTL